MLASDHWEISSLRRAFHFSYWDLLSLDEPKGSPKTEQNETWKVERLTRSLNLEIKLACLEHRFFFNNCHFDFDHLIFKSQLKWPILEPNCQIKVASVCKKNTKIFFSKLLVISLIIISCLLFLYLYYFLWENIVQTPDILMS